MYFHFHNYIQSTIQKECDVNRMMLLPYRDCQTEQRFHVSCDFDLYDTYVINLQLCIHTREVLNIKIRKSGPMREPKPPHLEKGACCS